MRASLRIILTLFFQFPSKIQQLQRSLFHDDRRSDRQSAPACLCVAMFYYDQECHDLEPRCSCVMPTRAIFTRYLLPTSLVLKLSSLVHYVTPL